MPALLYAARGEVGRYATLLLRSVRGVQVSEKKGDLSASYGVCLHIKQLD